MSTALVPGSFDPPTNGHIDVIARCSAVFDRVVVSVLRNSTKQPLFTPDDRIDLLSTSCVDMGNVEIESFEGLLVDYAGSIGADVIVKGLRAISDFDYELSMAQMNRNLSGIVTMFVATKPEFSYLSSSMVKEVARFGGSVSGLVPSHVEAALRERISS
jgi:pantetheine-phosphate adenylyltransferase